MQEKSWVHEGYSSYPGMEEEAALLQLRSTSVLVSGRCGNLLGLLGLLSLLLLLLLLLLLRRFDWEISEVRRRLLWPPLLAPTFATLFGASLGAVLKARYAASVSAGKAEASKIEAYVLLRTWSYTAVTLRV